MNDSLCWINFYTILLVCISFNFDEQLYSKSNKKYRMREILSLKILRFVTTIIL